MSFCHPNNRSGLIKIIPPAFLVAGNVLGIGLLALPVKLGISGYLPSVVDIIVISLAMVVSALVIAERLPRGKKVFDLPSFFQQEMGVFGKWIAIICNLIILYGIIVAYLSGISQIIYSLLPLHLPRPAIMILYFCFATSLIIFGRGVLRKSSTLILISIVICFVILLVTGSSHFDTNLLTTMNWKYVPIGLPVVISAFHFHNVIPTVSTCVDHNAKDLRKVILIGVGIGLVMNLAWTTAVLGTLPHAEIMNAFFQGIPATVPMSLLLGSKVFTIAGLIFAFFAITASYMANGSGLFGFIKDLLYTYAGKESMVLSSVLAFGPTLIIALVYPNVFLTALDLVGGIGEAMLFGVLPGLILVRMVRKKLIPAKYGLLAQIIGYIVFAIGAVTMIYVGLDKLGLMHLVSRW